MALKFLDRLFGHAVTLVFPACAFGFVLLAGAWHVVAGQTALGAPLSLAVWEAPAGVVSAPADIDRHLAATPPRSSFNTQLSTQDFWLNLQAQAPTADAAWSIELPSRHAMSLQCWDSKSDVLLGSADRSGTHGRLSTALSGFAIDMPPGQMDADLRCRATFRGPAHISAEIWSTSALAIAQASYTKTSTMIEASLGMLALSLALTALINRSRLYAAFVGLIFVSMRMAALSEGTDFTLFGVPLPADWLTPARQWTVCLYFVMTVAVFGLLFSKEMEKVGGQWLLGVQRATALFILGLCMFLSYEQILPALWVVTVVLFAATLPYIYLMLRRTRSRPAYWYAASIVVALVATLGEVLAAALGHRGMLGSLNSVTAALASALLASAAVAEHMRSDRREREAAQRTLKAAYDDSPVGLFTVHEGTFIANSNAACKAMLDAAWAGAQPRLDDLFDGEVALAFAAMHASGQAASMDLQARLRGSGSEHWFAIKASTLDGNIVEGSMQDITDRVHATSRLEFLVNHDPLTECLNLRGLTRHCERIAQPPRTLAYFDLDRFKLINDLYGHSAGDAVLKQACERIRSQLLPGDLLARVGGDEFVVAFPDASIAEASRRCENICALISSAPFQIEAQRFALSVSGGLVAAEGFGGAALKELISAADTLCRVAKKRPNERLVVMGGGDTFFKHHKAELELISCLELGKTPEGLFLVMQPELSLSRPFESLNFEVLLRLRKPNGEIVPAPVIVEAAEAHAKTAIIDRWVVTSVIHWIEENHEQLQNTQFIGVNLSGASLNDESFITELFQLFERHKAAVSRVCIEITETVALTDMGHMQRFIDRARDLGVKVALDDFGAGYSSFGYLKGLSVDALKLDGSLVRDAAVNPSGMAILSALGGLVRDLGMKSIGEYAENLPILKALVAAGVDYAQGYAISRPVPPERILAARSTADFIVDPAVYAFVQQLQQDSAPMPLMADGDTPRRTQFGPPPLH